MMRTIRDTHVFFILLCICFSGQILVSCAHKSGPKHRNAPFGYSSGASNGYSSEYSREKSRQRDPVRTASGHGREKMDAADIFRRYNSAVFMVLTTDGRNMYQGSGFFLDAHGLAVSNYHVFQGTGIGAELIKVVGRDSYCKVSEILYRSKKYDFILFRVGIDCSNYIPIAARKPSVGEKVFAIGSPRGLENTFSSGEVSQWRDSYLMQISALIDHGSSGGALINEYGEAVGITSGTFYDGSQANLNYAWSMEAVKPYLP